MTHKGNMGILSLLTSFCSKNPHNVQTELRGSLKTLNFDSTMLKGVIGTKVTQFLSFWP